MSRQVLFQGDRSEALALIATALVLTLAGCSAPKTVDMDAGGASIAPGETLVIDFGTINPSVGDEWVVTTEPDAAVVDSGEWEFDYQGEEGSTGGSSDAGYVVHGAEKGTTTIGFEYRFRGEVPEDAEDQRTVEFTITVE